MIVCVYAKKRTVRFGPEKMLARASCVVPFLAFLAFALNELADRPESVIVCIPPCGPSAVICTWNDGGNGFKNGSDCQRKCGEPVGDGAACKLSRSKICYWGWTKDAGFACFSGPVPCDPNETVFNSALMDCKSFNREYGGCGNCTNCCSKTCHCRDLIEDKCECVCGTD